MNLPPVVQAGSAFTAAVATPVPLSGSVTDDGLPASPPTVHWSTVSGPATALITNAAAAVTTAVFPETGTYVLRLSASDSQLSAVSDVTVTVIPGANQAPVLDLGADRSVAVGATLTVIPAISDDGLPSGTVSALWSLVSGPGAAALHSLPNGGVSGIFNRIGTYVLRLTATDGALSTVRDLAVQVTPLATAPPLVALTFPSADSSLSRPLSLTLQAQASDPDAAGGVASVSFYDGATLLGQDPAPDAQGHAQLAWSHPAPGAHTLTAVATDFSGTTAASAPVVLTVLPAQPVVALTNPVASTAFPPGSSVQLQASASAGSEALR